MLPLVSILASLNAVLCQFSCMLPNDFETHTFARWNYQHCCLFSECTLQISFRRQRHHPKCCLINILSHSQNVFIIRFTNHKMLHLCLKLYSLGGATINQGCGLGLDVSVSRRINVSSRRKSSTCRSRLGLGRLTSRSLLGLGH